MTIFTQSYNFQPILAGIGSMMILFGLLAARTYVFLWCRHPITNNSIIDGCSGSALVSVVISIACTFFSTVWTSIPYCRGLSYFWRFLVSLSALFTHISISIRARSVFVKLRQRFFKLAFVAVFCLNGLRHDRYSNNGYRLEPIAAHSAIGLFYYSLRRRTIK